MTTVFFMFKTQVSLCAELFNNLSLVNYILI